MAKTLDQLAKEIYNEALADGEAVTMEEAVKMAEMELKAKGFSHEATATEKKERKPKERKVDNEKLTILNWLERGLYENGGIHSERETETKLHFEYEGNQFTINLIKHRPKK